VEGGILCRILNSARIKKVDVQYIPVHTAVYNSPLVQFVLWCAHEELKKMESNAIRCAGGACGEDASPHP
jgi:hypothetical protein